MVVAGIGIPINSCLSGWHSVNAHASHRCDTGLIPGVGM